MKKFFILPAVLAAFTASANNVNGIWQRLSAGIKQEIAPPALNTAHYEGFSANEVTLRAYLATAPADPSKGIRINLPAPDGEYRVFRVWSTPVLDPALAAKFPEIQTYTAELEGNPRVTAKLDYSPNGFHAYVFDGAKSYLVNPYGKRASGYYAASYKSDLRRAENQTMNCELGDETGELPEKEALAQRMNGTTRKTYRMALSCTGEYAKAVEGNTPTKAGVLARMVTTMNRVNGVYERELAVTMTIIPNNDLLIYLDETTDPFVNNSNGPGLLNENQTNTNAVVGSAAYDIGHIFSTGGGGIAGLGVVCQAGGKARGVTGNQSPMGDGFDIDFVAHEIGHQFGANHTFNATGGSCTGNGARSIAFEPGSGSTIMAYAGLCGANNLQNSSNDYFHSASLEQITTYITSGTGASCPVTSASPNTNATLPAFAATYAIPANTFFELTAPQATDATADTALNYCWEQRDLGNFGGTLASTTTAGPLFRSFAPDINRTRVFIEQLRMLEGVKSYNGERLPTATRVMTFGLTQRDYFQGWGTFNFPDDRITLQVEAMDAFAVTYPAGGEVWTGGDFQTITWDASNTASAPVSCANVDIYMSVDGGYTWPYLLASGTPNDGSQRVQIPNAPGGFARIKVKGSNNVFFAVSGGDNTIVRGTVGVGSTPVTESVSLSPVPAHSSLRVSVPQSLGKVDLRLINMLGQTVWTGAVSGDQTLDASVWPRGIYQMSMHNGQGFRQTRKLTLE